MPPCTMSPLTPPCSHKEKENLCCATETRSVSWSENEEVHSLSTPLKTCTVPSKKRPAAKQSILKKSNKNAMLTAPVDTKRRECTPEPSEVLSNCDYLTRPVAQITLVDDPNSLESLAELIEGYHVLAARLRTAITESTTAGDGDSSWPLFEPLRKNSEQFVDAVVRDLGRALVDPLSLSSLAEEELVSKSPLPTPERSPSKKKGGMTGEQVKYARDLCTTCHSVIRALSVIFALPSFYGFLEEKHLRRILTAILAIPLADELPTPNSRKTCALAIWLIQMQRLPATVLQPAADRITYALRRGIDGELGKEGKKGSATDGLKAICDLCEYLPQIFVPAFVPLVPSILSNLVANTLTLRTQACHALGGFVLGLTSLPRSTIHTKVASMVAAYLTAPATPTKSPSKSTEPSIVRTLRATMNQTEPEQPAQGPVWGLSVLASLVVLLNERLCTDPRVNRQLCSLLAMGIRHKKGSIRALTCLTWRCLTWVYFQPPLPVENDEEPEVDDFEEQMKRSRRAHCKIMMSVLECQTGIANIAGLLGDESSRMNHEPLRLCVELLKTMAAKSGHPCYDATQTMMQMVRPVNGEQDEHIWDHNLLLPKSLFSTSNNLFITEYKDLTQAIRPLFENVASVADVRPLTREEMTKDWVLSGLMTAWKSALGHLELGDEADMPPELVTTWVYLLKANVNHLRDNEDGVDVSKFGASVVKYLIDIVEDPNLNLAPSKSVKGVGPANRKNPISDSDDLVSDTFPGLMTCTNSELRLRVVGRMWKAMKTIFPRGTLCEAAEMLLACLMRNEKSILPESARLALEEEGERARNSWVILCVDLLGICDSEAMRVFWGCEEGGSVVRVVGTWGWDWTKEFTNAVWKAVTDNWRDQEGDWESAVILLGIPFLDKHAWNVTSEDFILWEEFLGYTTAKALDHGLDSSTVLDNIASFVSSFQTPGAQPYLSTRLADLLLSNLDVPEMRTIPQDLVDLVSETMRSNYPPGSKNKAVMRWLARSLMTLIEKSPSEFCLSILQAVQEGVSLWLADEFGAWEEDELNYDLIPLYQLILVTIQTLPDPVSTLCAVGDILGSVFRYRVPSLAVEAFTDFWNLAYTKIPAPQSGWPEGISHALHVVGLLPRVETLPDAVVLGPAFDFNATPHTPISALYSTPPTTVFRREAFSRISSPQRPQKVFGKFPIVPTSPVSPTVIRRSRTATSSVTARTPLSAIQPGESPSKRRRLNSDGKENISIGNKPLVSVAERIAEIMKPNGTLPRKRKFDLDGDGANTSTDSSTPTPSKRLKARMKPRQTKSLRDSSTALYPASSMASSCSNESEEECQSVEKLLNLSSVPFPSMDAEEQSILEADVPTRKVANYGHDLESRTEIASGEQPKRRPDAARLDDQTHDVVPKRIDLTQVRKSVKRTRTASTPAELWRALKRKASERDDDDSEELHDLNKTAHHPLLKLSTLPAKRSRTCLVPARRTASMPERLDSDVTVVELPVGLQKTNFVDKLADAMEEHDIEPPHFGSDVVSLPGSDDTVTDNSSSEEDSPTKGVISRSLHRKGSESRFFKAVVMSQSMIQ